MAALVEESMVLVMEGRLVVTGVDEDVVGWTVGVVVCC